jgi:hypothetical protein
MSKRLSGVISPNPERRLATQEGSSRTSEGARHEIAAQTQADGIDAVRDAIRNMRWDVDAEVTLRHMSAPRASRRPPRGSSGPTKNRIVSEIFSLLDDEGAYNAMARAHNPFGDGKAATRIAEIVARAHR